MFGPWAILFAGLYEFFNIKLEYILANKKIAFDIYINRVQCHKAVHPSKKLKKNCVFICPGPRNVPVHPTFDQQHAVPENIQLSLEPAFFPNPSTPGKDSVLPSLAKQCNISEDIILSVTNSVVQCSGLIKSLLQTQQYSC